MTASPVRYDPTARFEVTSRDVEYARHGEISLLARVYQPQGPGPFPMIIDIHGGGWKLYDRLRQAAIAEEMAGHGILWASIDMRLNGRAPYPAAAQDINYAVRWFKAHAAEFKGSADHFGIFGVSSGGHQVIMAALRPRHPDYTAIPLREAPNVDATVRYVIASGAAVDLIESMNAGDQFKLDQYMGGVAGVRAHSPQHVIESDEPIDTPPMLIVQAGAEKLVGFTTDKVLHFARTYVERRKGNIEVAMFPDAPHIFINRGLVPESEAMLRALPVIKFFIARQLDYLAKPFGK
ncbi:MAG: alpha/beta hydrolase [Burkholderiales bacterium]